MVRLELRVAVDAEPGQKPDSVLVGYGKRVPRTAQELAQVGKQEAPALAASSLARALREARGSPL
jgi:hypothetical protein